MLKKEIRQLYRNKRMALSEKERLIFHDLLLIQFQRLEIEIPDIMMSYVPFEYEYDPTLVEDYCQFKNPGIAIGIPVVNPHEPLMKCVEINDATEYEKNVYGIPEPRAGIEMDASEIGMIILPLLAFDKKGYRVGYGKGYYDRFIKNHCTENVVKIGFSFFEPMDTIEDVHEYDVCMDYCITPETIYSFDKSNSFC